MDIVFVKAFFDPATIGVAVGLATSAFGLFSQNKANKSQARAERAYEKKSNELNAAQAGISEDISEVSIKNEQIREQQASLDFRRARREAIRKAQLARSVSTSRGAAQGAISGSGVAGGQSQIAAELSANLNALDQNFQLGTASFQNNRDILGLQNQSAQLGSQQNALNTQFKRQSSVNQNNAAFGQTLFSTGLNIVGNSEKINQVGSSFGTALFTKLG